MSVLRRKQQLFCMEQALKASCHVNHKRKLVLDGSCLLSEKLVFVLLFFLLFALVCIVLYTANEVSVTIFSYCLTWGLLLNLPMTSTLRLTG